MNICKEILAYYGLVAVDILIVITFLGCALRAFKETYDETNNLFEKFMLTIGGSFCLCGAYIYAIATYGTLQLLKLC
jgi:hypothetical protein